MELNREQIIKALECCIKTQCENCCNLGSWHEQWNCMTDLMKKALSLINQLESDNAKLAEANAIQTITAVEINKQVQRLTEEVNDLKEDKELYSVFCEDYKGQIKKLAEENERLRADVAKEFTCVFGTPHKVSDCPITDEIAKAKADTVRKMQERLNKECLIDRGYEVLLEGTIDQIAKEMVEGKNEKG